MEQAELDYIVNLVAQQVMSAIGGCATDASPQTEGLPKVLLVGNGPVPPRNVGDLDAVYYDLEDYKSAKNILRYDRVLITHLTTTQLADIAQGRMGDETSCAVLHALLSGVEVFMMEDALPFRRFAGKGSTALYHLLEGYAQTLQVFGVKPLGPKRRKEPPEARPPKFAAPPVKVPEGSAQPNEDRLITEMRALELVKSGGEVRLPARAIVTPAARDVFTQAGVRLIQDS